MNYDMGSESNKLEYVHVPNLIFGTDKHKF